MEDQEIYRIQAELCQAVGNPVRLHIIHILRQGGLFVSDLTKLTGLPQANVSRHLTILRNAGLVHAQRHGANVRYSLANPKIVAVCDMMRDIIAAEQERLSALLSTNFSGDTQQPQ